MDDAISRLLEPDGQSSTSSARGSSSVERDIDSEDEDPIRGPNKRQDRRLSRATRAIAKETGDQPNQELSFRLKDNVMSATGQYSTTSRRNNTAAAKLAKLEDANETEEEDWRTDSPYKDSESASVSTSASDFSSASKPPPGIIRLKLSQPKKPLERCETPSTSLREQEAISRKNISHYKGQQGTSPKRRPAARDRYGVKKAAQKAAAKERKQAVAAKQPTSGKNAALPFIMKPGKENAPAIEAHIKVLYI